MLVVGDFVCFDVGCVNVELFFVVVGMGYGVYSLDVWILLVVGVVVGV